MMKKLIILTLFASPLAGFAATQVITIKPSASPQTSAYMTGSCFSTSITSQRPDAWRCNVGPKNAIYDPCFSAANSKNLVVCGINPITNDNGFTVQVPNLPKPKFRNLQTWLIQLPDGSYCQQIISPEGGSGFPTDIMLTDKNNKPTPYTLFYTCSGTTTNGILANSIVPGDTWKAKRVYYSGHVFDSVEDTDIAKVWE